MARTHTPGPITQRTLKGVPSGSKIRYAGRGDAPAKPTVLTVTRSGSKVTLIGTGGKAHATFGAAVKVWIGDTSVTALPAQSVAPKPKPKVTPKPKPKTTRRAASDAVVTSVTGLSVAQLSERARKAAASRAARKADPKFVPPSQRGSALPENHPHRIRAAKAAESRKRAIADPSYVPPSRMPKSADRHEAALQAWATRRAATAAAEKAAKSAARKAKSAKSTTATRTRKGGKAA